jgi:hypothetical protein
MSYTFLSDEWFAEAKKLRDEAGDIGGDTDLKLNVVVTGGPEGDKEVHLASGQFGQGLVEGAPTKLTVPFDVAKATFVEGNQQAAMQAFMSGQLKIEGDMTKIMMMQNASPSPEAQQLQEKLRAITAS